MTRIAFAFVVATGMLLTHAARAQAPAAGSGSGTPTEIVSADKPVEADAKTSIQGWNPFVALTASLNVVDNSSVIGQVDGTAVTAAAGVTGGADYIHGPHNVLLTGLINEGFARTPVINQFVKINDVAKVDGIYNYFVTPNFGGYARLSLATALFNSTAVVATPTTFLDVTSMTPVTLAANTQTFRLADAGKPFTATESVGAFADPINKPKIAVSFRLGIGGRSTFANGSYAIHPNPMDTTAVELLALSNVEQIGVEGFAGVHGTIADKGTFTYRSGIAVLFPFVNDDTYHRSAGELTRIACTTNFTYALSKWMSMVYNLSILRDPQLFPAGKDQVEIQNTFLLTFQLSLIKKKEGPKAKTKDQLELEAAKLRAEEADKRASAADQRATEADERATEAERKLVEQMQWCAPTQNMHLAPPSTDPLVPPAAPAPVSPAPVPAPAPVLAPPSP
jgi:hypothetical protein